MAGRQFKLRHLFAAITVSAVAVRIPVEVYLLGIAIVFITIFLGVVLVLPFLLSVALAKQFCERLDELHRGPTDPPQPQRSERDP